MATITCPHCGKPITYVLSVVSDAMAESDKITLTFYGNEGVRK